MRRKRRKKIKVKVRVVERLNNSNIKYKGEMKVGPDDNGGYVATAHFDTHEEAVDALASAILINSECAHEALRQYNNLVSKVVSNQSPVPARDILYKTTIDAIKEYILPQYILEEEEI